MVPYSFALTCSNARFWMNRGDMVQTPVPTVMSGKKEAMVAAKVPYSTAGCSGVVVFEIPDESIGVFIAWTAPYQFLACSNWLSIGLQSGGRMDSGMVYHSTPMCYDEHILKQIYMYKISKISNASTLSFKVKASEILSTL